MAFEQVTATGEYEQARESVRARKISTSDSFSAHVGLLYGRSEDKPMDTVQLEKLISGLQGLTSEKEWVEFKENKANPEDIGEYISSLANGARLTGEPFGYMVWGLNDQTHELVGTQFVPEQTKQGNEELENWLVRGLSPRLDIRFYTCLIENKAVVVLEIPATLHTPVRFKDTGYIRVGSLKKKLKDYPEKERELWQILNASQFEQDLAKSGLDSDDVLKILDYPRYFDMTEQPLPSNKVGILEKLTSDKLIKKLLDGWAITNLGAILFAKDLTTFDRLSRKGLRVIQYVGNSRVQTKRETSGQRGYATGFENAIDYINNLLPENEVIGQALRKRVRMYPELAVRELVANALIHQDLTITGTGPMVEIFDNRIEITNPGTPLVDTLRSRNEPPRSRNESLAAIMRRMNICEERGSGIDKVISAVEDYQLPAPDFKAKETAMVVTLHASQDWSAMEKTDRVRACYQHACLKYVSGEKMTNATLRVRFDLEASQASRASQIIKDAIAADLIKRDESNSRKYLPYWA